MSRLQITDKQLSLRANMVWNSVGSFFYLVCNWVITVLVVRLSGSYSDSGVLAIAMAVGNVAATIALFKVRPVQVASSDEDYLLGDYVGFRVATSVAALAVSLVYMLFTTSMDNAPVVVLYVGFKIVESYVDVYHAEFQKIGRMDISSISQIIRGLLIVVFFCCGLLLFHSLLVSICLMLLSETLVVASYDHAYVVSWVPAKPRFNWTRIRCLAVQCAPGFISTLAITYIVSNTRQSFGLEYGNEMLGVYAAIATPTVIIQTLASFIYSPLYGPIGEACRKGDRRWLVSLVGKMLAAIVVVLVLGCVVARILGEPFFTLLYGSTVAGYVYLVYGALATTAASASLYFLFDLLIVLGCQKGLMITSILLLLLCPCLTRALLGSDPNSVSVTITACYAAGIVLALIFAAVSLPRKKESVQ